MHVPYGDHVTILRVQCPYCGHLNKLKTIVHSGTQEAVVTCNCETGGCDRYFAIVYRFKAVIDTYTMNLEK